MTQFSNSKCIRCENAGFENRHGSLYMNLAVCCSVPLQLRFGAKTFVRIYKSFSYMYINFVHIRISKQNDLYNSIYKYFNFVDYILKHNSVQRTQFSNSRHILWKCRI